LSVLPEEWIAHDGAKYTALQERRSNMVRIPLHWAAAFVVSKVAGIPIERASRIVNIVALALAALCLRSAFSRANSQEWDSSPLNWKNSDLNWNSSPMNW
jgi:hypothetical protein